MLSYSYTVENFSHVLSLRPPHHQNTAAHQAAVIYSNAICIRRGAGFPNWVYSYPKSIKGKFQWGTYFKKYGSHKMPRGRLFEDTCYAA